MSSSPKPKIKDKLNYDALRRMNQQRLKSINDIYIESQLAISGFSLLMEELDKENEAKTTSGQKVIRHVVETPSVRGKLKDISRSYVDIRTMIQGRIDYKEHLQSLVFAISLTEGYISNTLMLILRAYPQKIFIPLKGKEKAGANSMPVELKDILDLQTVEAVIRAKAAQRIHEALYATPKAYMAYVEAVLSFKFPEGLLDQFAEIKATRDIFVHGDGTVNETYVRKAGLSARKGVGERLSIDGPYIKTSVSCMKDIFSSIYKGMLASFGDSKPLSILLIGDTPETESI